MFWRRLHQSDALLPFVNLVPTILHCCGKLKSFSQVIPIRWSNLLNLLRRGSGPRSRSGLGNELALIQLSDNSVAAAWEQFILANELMGSLKSRSRLRYLSVAPTRTRSCDDLR